jgi:hypothetical protein
MHWVLTFLQEMRQDIRDVNRRVDEMGLRIDELGVRMDQRLNRQTTTHTATMLAIIAAVRL